ncbi:hypothetical protein Nham_2803 [Nitrobacter hamburgensis X14]|uniref:L-carnitine dehydratase/bile acid-inducible protein F n=1 Tax=Nitrobacter hamburgensis (strain DSM 10229 / NCIMB 13809 / X14) TaxID=323097 RepID=Q1QJM3_NITHX|nr:hypothetical protein Nham_2803 [Nitrobacter hamburgensis X14]
MHLVTFPIATFRSSMNGFSPHLPGSFAFTVLDLTRARSGSTAVRQLADWGANVIKIEALTDADGEQPSGPRHCSDFQNLHRNKHAMTLNLEDPKVMLSQISAIRSYIERQRVARLRTVEGQTRDTVLDDIEQIFVVAVSVQCARSSLFTSNGGAGRRVAAPPRRSQLRQPRPSASRPRRVP